MFCWGILCCWLYMCNEYRNSRIHRNAVENSFLDTLLGVTLVRKAR